MDLTQNIYSEDEDQEIELPSATPLWKYVTKVPGEKKGGGGSTKFVCNFECQDKHFTGSYSRIRAHLIGVKPGEKKQGINLCPKVNKDMRDLLKEEEEDAQRIFCGNAKAKKLKRPKVCNNVFTYCITLIFDSHTYK
ncbi:hypothetical protein Dimus_037818 [Dionaea muscipula]